MIRPSDHLALLSHTLTMHGFSPEWLRIVPDVAKAATMEGWPDDNPKRAAKVLYGDHDPTIWIRETFDSNLHFELVMGSCYYITGDWDDAIAERLDDAATFLTHLLLHEIGHVLFRQNGEEETEEAIEKWAYERLDVTLAAFSDDSIKERVIP